TIVLPLRIRWLGRTLQRAGACPGGGPMKDGIRACTNVRMASRNGERRTNDQRCLVLARRLEPQCAPQPLFHKFRYVMRAVVVWRASLHPPIATLDTAIYMSATGHERSMRF